PDPVPDERREDAEVQHRNPTRETHRLKVGYDARSRREEERDQEDRTDQKRPRDEREGRIPPKVAFAQDGVERGEDRRRDHGQGALRGAERELALRAHEKDHDRQACEREGDASGLPASDALLQERDRKDGDERRVGGDDQCRRARADVRIRFPRFRNRWYPVNPKKARMTSRGRSSSPSSDSRGTI